MCLFAVVESLSMAPKIDIPKDQIAECCERWQIKELALFGSTLREDFQPDSDVDVLVVFEDNAPWDLFDLMRAEEELECIFGRKVDLVEKNTIRNPLRRQHILKYHEIIYAS
jgi:predicted nucleotidyltransferase